MSQEHPMRVALGELDKTLSRRSFFGALVKTTGLVAAFDRFGPQMFGAESDGRARTPLKPMATGFLPLPYVVGSAIGRLVIPEDQDPGWATYDPGITQYMMDVFVNQVVLGGNALVYQGYQGAMSAFNEIPVDIGYANLTFLDMNTDLQTTYFAAALAGLFEDQGVQDILNVAALLTMFASKGTFFSNYPYHIANRGAEFQIIPPHKLKTGWDIMQYTGAIGPDEEAQLRAKAANVQILPGIDTTNPYI
jgi:hypothetical protein